MSIVNTAKLLFNLNKMTLAKTAIELFFRMLGKPSLILSRLSMVLLPCAVAACLVVPIHDEEPYTEEQLAFVEPGVTNRDQMHRELGQPIAVRNEGRLSIYADAQKMAFVGAGSDYGYVAKPHCCVVEYDDAGVVTDVAVIRDEEGCTSAGYCVKPIFVSGKSEPRSDGAIVFALPSDDSAAKAFVSNEDRCGLFLYLTGLEWAFKVFRPDKPPVYLDLESYLHWRPLPGRVEMRVETWNAKTSSGYKFDCEAGENYFIHIHSKVDFFSGVLLLQGVRMTWREDDLLAGREFVSQRRLILDQ